MSAPHAADLSARQEDAIKRMEAAAKRMEDMIEQLTRISIARPAAKVDVKPIDIVKPRTKQLTRQEAIDAGHDIKTGPRGGVYYTVNSKKVYVKHAPI